jgi:hypothetical protein
MTTRSLEQPAAGIPGARGYEGAYIAHLWEQPRLCLAIFGVQFLTAEGQRRYEESGITEEMMPALADAQDKGWLLLNRHVTSDEGPLLLQYWRSYDDLDNWARNLPHMRWWRWLLENAGPDISFYHEIYTARSAEAIYERGCRPVGPALFTTTSTVEAGEGHSRDRQERYQRSVNSFQSTTRAGDTLATGNDTADS